MLAKALIIDVPKGWNLLVECDIPFKLPSIDGYRSSLDFGYHHERQSREVHKKLEEALAA